MPGPGLAGLGSEFTGRVQPFHFRVVLNGGRGNLEGFRASHYRRVAVTVARTRLPPGDCHAVTGKATRARAQTTSEKGTFFCVIILYH